MFQYNKYTIFSLVVFCIFLVGFFPSTSQAQTCGGSSASSCTSQQTSITYWTTLVICTGTTDTYPYLIGCYPTTQKCANFCTFYTQSFPGYSCNNPVNGQSGCGACIPSDQFCTQGNLIGYDGDINSPYYTQACYNGNTTGYYVTSPNGALCGSNDLKYCTDGCTSYCTTGTANCTSCANAPYNTCSSNNGTQTCQHDSPQTCTATNFTNSCQQNNCDGGAGYACGGGVCRKTLGGYVTDAWTGKGLYNVAVGGSGSNSYGGLSYTDSSGYWSIGGWGYLSSFSISPNYSISAYGGTPCNQGYLCNGGSPNPTNRSGTVGGAGDCGSTGCNYVFTPGEISGHVYIDYNHDGKVDGGDSVYTGGVTVSVSGPVNKSGTTDASGKFDLTYLNSGTYTVTVTAPAGYAVVNGGSTSVTIGPNNNNVYLYITPLYTTSGYVFNDINKDTKMDNGETGNNGVTINISGNGVNQNATTDSTGAYSFGSLLSGTYTVTYTTALATNYSFTTNSAWSVTVGNPVGISPTCSTSSSPDATCGGQNNGSISNLNFGVINENSHYQSACFDLRNNNNTGATLQDLLPGPGATCGGVNGSYATITDSSCSTGSGIVSSCNSTFNFGLGSANSDNWQVGGSTQECFAPSGINNIRTSYEYLQATAQQSGITPTNLDNTVNTNPSTSCDITNCTLPANLPKGVYQVNGNLNLNGYTFPAPADPTTQYQSYIFLINGNLTINGNILIPQGSVAVFSTSGNIEVAANVGQNATNVNDPAINNPNLEGLYTADQSFIIDSNATGTHVCNADGSPIDLKLNIVGEVVSGAAQTGGQFVNNRDLCLSDLSCPSFSVGSGLEYLMTLMADGQFMLHDNYNWQEIKP